MKIFMTGKPFPTSQDKSEKASYKEQAQKDPKGSTNGKRKEKEPSKESNRLSPEEMEKYKKDNHCFKCGETGHAYCNCPKKQQKKETPQETQVQFPTTASDPATKLCFAWGKVRDQNSLILFDPGSTHNFISVELVQELGIQTEELGAALDAMGAFKGQQVPMTPLIGKLHLHVQGFVDQEEFYVSQSLKESSANPDHEDQMNFLQEYKRLLFYGIAR